MCFDPSEGFSSLGKFLIPRLISPGCLRIKTCRVLDCLHSFFLTKSLSENWNWFKPRRDIYVAFECVCAGGLKSLKGCYGRVIIIVEVTCKIMSLSILGVVFCSHYCCIIYVIGFGSYWKYSSNVVNHYNTFEVFLSI